jgi:hypothetical protein
MADDELRLGPTREEEHRPPWAPIGIGVALVLVVIGAVVLFTRSEAPRHEAHPYAANLKFTDLRLSAAENFVGGNVTYLDGAVTNAGDKTVNGITVDLTFHNQLGEVVQDETLRVMALSSAGPYPDVLDLHSAPIGPGKSRNFRLTLEHISGDWNRAAPDVKVTSVSFQ